MIEARALESEMYRKSFEVDDGRNIWNSGLWIRYKIFEEAIDDAPRIEAVPIEYILQWIDRQNHGRKNCKVVIAEALTRMIEDWRKE